MPKSYKSLAGYVSKIKNLTASHNGMMFFRGHGDKDFELMPSLYRLPRRDFYERDMLLGLISESPADFSGDILAFDKLVRAQHFGLPTRLLDITQNPLMGLYFACSSEMKSRGRVLVFSVSSDVKFFESDSVSCKANLAFLTGPEKVIIVREMQLAMDRTLPPSPEKLTAVREDFPAEWEAFIEAFNSQPTVRRLVQFIKQEKPYFEPRIDPLDLFSAEVVLPKKSNVRIAAQSGAFVIYGLNRQKVVRFARKFMSRLLADSSQQLMMESLDIDSGQKAKFLEELSAVNINQYTVYPELDKIAGFIKQKYFTR